MVLDSKTVWDAALSLKLSGKFDSNDTVSIVSGKKMLQVEQLAYDKIQDSVTRNRRGEASPRSVRDRQESPCAWCDHPDSCAFDSTIAGCRIVEINHKPLIEITQL